MRGSSQVGRWTPFVIAPTGTAEGSSSGQSAAKSVRETSPCRAETAFAAPESRRASMAMLNPAPGASGWRPSARNSSRERPSAPGYPPRAWSTRASS